MKGHVLSLFNAITVKESKDIVDISGFPAIPYASAVMKKWGTSKIANNIFRKLHRREVQLDSFFIPDFIYTLEEIIKDPNIYINRIQLRETVKKITTETWYSRVARDYPSRLKFKNIDKFIPKPLETQSEFLKVYDQYTQKYRLNGYLLAADPGTGKTLSSLFLSECLDTDITIAIVPKKAIYRVWDSTLASAYVKKPNYYIYEPGKVITKGHRYYVFHYEALDKALDFFKDIKGKRINIILDECHNFNDPDSVRTRLLTELCRVTRSTDVLWMSGTPIKALGSEMIPLLRTIDPYFTPNVETRFRAVFGLSRAKALDILAARLGFLSFKVSKTSVVKNDVRYYEVKVKTPNADYYTLDNLKKIMYSFVMERMEYYITNFDKYAKDYKEGVQVYENSLKSNDVKSHNELARYREYVEVIRQLYDPYLHKDIAKYCNDFEKNKIIPILKEPLKTKFRNARSVYKYYYLKVQGEALWRVLGKERVNCVIDMVRHANHITVTREEEGLVDQTSSLSELIDNSVNKTVIFTDYVEVVKETDKVLRKDGYTPSLVYQETNKNLSSIIKDFEKNEDTNPLIATMKSLSEAVPLVMADTVIFMNTPFRIHEYEQAVSRLDRYGQTEVVKVFNFYLDTGEQPNISTRSRDIMEWSREMVEAIMGRKVDDIAMEMFTEDTSEVVSQKNISTFLTW